MLTFGKTQTSLLLLSLNRKIRNCFVSLQSPKTHIIFKTKKAMNKRLKIGITHGDINGISYEIILKALSNPQLLELCTPIIYGQCIYHLVARRSSRRQSIHHQLLWRRRKVGDRQTEHRRRSSGSECPKCRHGRPYGQQDRRSGNSSYQQKHDTVRQIQFPGTYRVFGKGSQPTVDNDAHQRQRASGSDYQSHAHKQG